MQKSVGFVRIKPIQCEKSAEARANDDELFDPFVAIKILDAENVPGQCTSSPYIYFPPHGRRSREQRRRPPPVSDKAR